MGEWWRVKCSGPPVARVRVLGIGGHVMGIMMAMDHLVRMVAATSETTEYIQGEVQALVPRKRHFFFRTLGAHGQRGERDVYVGLAAGQQHASQMVWWLLVGAVGMCCCTVV